MRNCWKLVLTIPMLFCTNTWGEVLPSFDLENSALRATDIVVTSALSGDTTTFKVVDVWKGQLKKNEHLHIPELGIYKDVSRRKIYDMLSKEQKGPIFVTPERVVLFLKRKLCPEGILVWLPALERNEVTSSVVWIVNGKCYALLQENNPGPQAIQPLINYQYFLRDHDDKVPLSSKRLCYSENQLRQKVLEILLLEDIVRQRNGRNS